MIFSRFIFTFLLTLATTTAISQSKEAIIGFELKHIKNQQIEFIVNGEKIIPDIKKYKIKIYEKDFDTILCYKNGKQASISLLKFKQNTEYLIRINPCSFYDIAPVRNPKKGVVRYNYISSKNDSIYALLDFCSQKINARKKTNYFSFISSAMCVFGKKKIALLDSKTQEELSSVYFHFLHGEKLTLNYNREKQKQNITLDGYINEEENYPIMEITN